MSALPAMHNLNEPATEPGKLSEQDFESRLHEPWRIPPPIRVSRPLWLRVWRAMTRPVLRWWYEHQADCIKAERKHYEDSGMPIGPQYRRNSDEQLRDLRSKQAWLDLE